MSQRVKEGERERQEENDEKNVFTSLFSVGGRGLKRFRLFRPSGHFHVFEDGAGITKKIGRCIFGFCCTFYINWL
jgi:hypothetical protein